MEDEARVILRDVVKPVTRDIDAILARVRAPLAEIGFVEFELPARDGISEPPDFSGHDDRLR